MKSIFEFSNMWRVREVLKVMFLKMFLLSIASITRRVTNTAVKNEHTIPIMRVVANPLIGPEPLRSRIIPVMIEVKLESKIAENAFL